MMLHTEAVPETLLALLRRLMAIRELHAFYLVGGTSLALRLGHRESIDLDLFTHEPFDARGLSDYLNQDQGMNEAASRTNTVTGLIDGMCVDCIAHRYPLLSPVEVIDGIRMASLEDVAAMKLNAVANRGSKKDFWDLAYLLSRFTRDDLLDCYARKYPRDNLWNVERSLVYFDDAETEPDPRDLKGRSWEEIKGILARHIRL